MSRLGKPSRLRGLIALAVAGVVAVSGAGLHATASRGADAPATATTTGAAAPTTAPAPTTPGVTAPGVTVPAVTVPDLTAGPTTTAFPTVGISTLPPTTLPPPAPPPTFTVEPHRTIETDLGRGPQFVPTVILPPSAEHGWLLIGDYRSNPGAVTQVVAYAAPASSPREWNQLAFTGEDQPTSVKTALTMPDGHTLIFGSADGPTGPSPAMWTLQGAVLSEPQLVGPETPFGRVTAAAVGTDGTVYAVIQRYTIRQRVSFELGKRAPDGTWTFNPLTLPAFDIFIAGIAISGSTIVLSGDGQGDQSESGFRALAFVSTDAGATFTLADTTALAATDRTTTLGAITTGPDGFYASACLSASGAQRQAIATSADGRTWSEYPFTGPDYVVPQYSAGCGSIVVDDEGGVWLSGFHSFDSIAYRVLNGSVDRVAVSYVDGDDPLFNTSLPMQIGVGGGTLAMSTPQVGGPMTGFAAVSSAANLDDPHQIAAAGTAPPGHEIVWDLDVVNDLGNVVGLVTYPHISVVGESTLYRPRILPYTLSDVGQPTLSPDATPTNPETGGGLNGVVSLPTGDVALASYARGDNPDEAQGTVGDVFVSRRAPGGEWSPLATVIGGPGGQLIRDVTVVGGLVVGVGDTLVTNPTTFVDEGKPFVLFGDGTTFSRIDLDVGGSLLARVYSVCAMPDSRALVIGYDRQSGSPFSALVDLTAGTAQIFDISISPAGTVPQRCVGAREGAFVEAGSLFDDGNVLYATRDGVSFTPVDVLAEDDAMYRIRSGAAGVAIVGITGPAGEDAFVLFGPTIDSLQRVDVPGFVGAGVQVAYDVVVGDQMLYVIGTINNSPVVWPISFG